MKYILNFLKNTKKPISSPTVKGLDKRVINPKEALQILKNSESRAEAITKRNDLLGLSHPPKNEKLPTSNFDMKHYITNEHNADKEIVANLQKLKDKFNSSASDLETRKLFNGYLKEYSKLNRKYK